MPNATRITRSRKWTPSIITTGRSSSFNGRDSHSANCCSLSATKRRDVALVDVDSAFSAGGNGSSVLPYRRIDTLAATAAIVAAFSGSAVAAHSNVGSDSSPALTSRARGRRTAIR
jgi:hypothetical protein